MMKKPLALLTMIALIVFDMSCITLHKVRQEPGGDIDRVSGKGVEIVDILTKTGETLTFAGGQRGRIEGDAIVGLVADPAGSEMTITQDRVWGTEKDKNGMIHKLTAKDGSSYRTFTIGQGQPFTSIRIEADRYVLVSPEFRMVSVPLSEVDRASVRRKDETGSFFASLGVFFLVGFVIETAIVSSFKFLIRL
jgi:hypothetical protein